MKQKLLFLFSLIFISLTPAVQASTGAHGGGDNKIRPDYYAWFVGNEQGKELTYCISFGGKVNESSKAIGKVSELSLRIQKAVEVSFLDWRKYRQNRPPYGDAAEGYLIPRFGGDCRVHESDLQILVGDLPLDDFFGPVMAQRANFENPAAFSHLKNYDIKKGWGKGTIWLHDGAPFVYQLGMGKTQNLFWEKEGAIEILIMHEIGHVLGNGHVSGTIMDENIIHRVFQSQTNDLTNGVDSAALLTQIDDSSQMLPFAALGNDGKQFNKVGMNVQMTSENFKKRFGENIEGNATLVISWPDMITAMLHIHATANNREFRVSMRPTHSKYFSGNANSHNVFNVCIEKTPKTLPDCCGIKRHSFVQTASVVWPTGMKEDLIISHNIPDQSEGNYSPETPEQYILDAQSIDSGIPNPVIFRSLSLFAK